MPEQTPAPTETAEHDSRLSWKRLFIFTALFLGLSAAGIYAIYTRMAERHFEFDQRLLSWPVLTGALGLLMVYFLSDGLRLYYAARALGHTLRLRWVFRLVFINIFVSNVTPMATGGGIAQVWYLQRRGMPLGTAMAATTVRTVLAVVFIFSTVPLATIVLRRVELASFPDRVVFYIALFCFTYLAFFAAVIFRTRWLLAPIQGMLNLAHRGHLLNDARYQHWSFRSRRELLRFRDGFRTYLTGPKRFVWGSIFWTAVFLVSLFSFPALLLWGLGYDLAYLQTLGIMVVTTFIMYFSPTPGASGIAEGVFGHFFSGLVSGNHLVLVIIAWRALTIYLGMLVGIFAVQHELTRPEAKH